MSHHTTTLSWKRTTADFVYATYVRDHALTFGTGSELDVSSAPEYKGNPALPNPEELLVGSLSSCHMLTFLAVAAREGFVVDAYDDAAVGVLEKNDAGRMSVTRVTLRPRVTFGVGGTQPDAETVKRLHDTSHRGCFIAQSVKTLVTVEGVSAR